MFMNKHTQTSHHDIGSLAEDARELMAATADVAGEKVGEARKRVAAALEKAKEMAGDLRDKAVAGAKATDKAINENPYKPSQSRWEWGPDWISNRSQNPVKRIKSGINQTNLKNCEY